VSTPYHSLYWATLLTLRAPVGIERLSQSLATARVDLNPHQVDAALFAIRSPLSKGVVLADEVGLGKTIEASLVIAQRWAERRRRVVLIVPATLRKQWQQELMEKFGIQSEILESAAFRQRGVLNAFDQPGKVMICSYQLAANKSFELATNPWDLVIMDEAHRLRNVYKKSSKIAATIRDATLKFQKILLTATPLQNSLMELFGLVSIVDPQVFGDERSFREQFADAALNPTSQEKLRERLKSLCIRTLRKQVLEYVPFTERHCITRPFFPTTEEHDLYERVSDYLQREKLVAIPNAQRQLITLVLRKLLASSTFAIANTLEGMASRLDEALKASEPDAAAEKLGLPDDDYEPAAETAEEWRKDEDEEETPVLKMDFDPGAARAEMQELRSFVALARRVAVNAKGQELLSGLEVAFGKVQELGAQRKAVVFTESRRTQSYLLGLLTEHGYPGQIVLMNATNADADSSRIYREWVERHKGTNAISGSPTADRKAAVVEEFRERATILIATESAAEGVNLQFCSLVVNYDLPWNPRRIEQRIGRCHRYGQKHDVVVVNFVNQRNAADQRVYALLKDKFRLFEGVFGASDEVLGALESGVDLEKRIAAVYQTCRSPEEIERAFAELQQQLDETIQTRMADTRRALLENFDDEVRERLRMSKEQAVSALNERLQWFSSLLKQELVGEAQFDEDGLRFTYTGDHGLQGRWNLDWQDAERRNESFLRVEHPLGQKVVEQACARPLECGRLRLDYRAYRRKIGMLEPLLGRSGWLGAWKLTTDSFDTEEFVVLAGVDDAGGAVSEEHCRRLLGLPAEILEPVAAEMPALDHLRDESVAALLKEADLRNVQYLDEEQLKLDRWAEDVKLGLEQQIREADKQIREAKRVSTAATSLEEKLAAQKQIKALEAARNKKRRELFEMQDKIEAQREELIERIQSQMKQTHEVKPLFAFEWTLVK
jgi:superfamily II DNA or RNA helicase